MAERPECGNCRWFRGDRPPLYEGGRAEGTCRIRSTPGDFPFRVSLEWCGEHQPTNAASASEIRPGDRPV